VNTHTRILRLSLVFAGLVALFALLLIWPNKASNLHDAPNQVVERP
jgi:hypothetical protein